MAIPPAESALSVALAVLSSQSGQAGSSSSSGSAADEVSLEALRRIKHAVIGSTARKLELARNIRAVQILAGFLDIPRDLSHSNGTADIIDIREACTAQSLAILAALALPRYETLAALLSISLHRRILTLLHSLDAASPILLPALRTLRALYNSLVSFVDPLASQTWAYELVLRSASAARGGGGGSSAAVNPSKSGGHAATSSTSTSPFGSTSPAGQPLSVAGSVRSNSAKWRPPTVSMHANGPYSSSFTTASKATSSNATPSEDNSDPSRVSLRKQVASVVESLLLKDNEAELLVGTLRAQVLRLSTYAKASKERENTYACIRCVCDILALCVRSQEQRDAVFRDNTATSTLLDLSADLTSIQRPHTDWNDMLDQELVLDPTNILFALLDNAPPQVAESVIAAIAALIKDENASSRRHMTVIRTKDGGIAFMPFVTTQGGPWAHITAYSTSRSAPLRLAAAECQVNLCKNLKRLGHGWERQLAGAPIVAALLQLLSDRKPEVSARAAFVLAYFVTDDRGLQETACNMDAFVRLRELLNRLARPIEPYETDATAAQRSLQQQAALLAIAALCMDIEDLRRKMVDARLLSHVITALSSPFGNVRCAAAQCTRALSRSTNLLKTAFVDTGAGPALFALLDPQEDLLTQLGATAVMCNVFMEFSPLKTVLLDLDGLIERIIQLTKSGKSSVDSGDDPRAAHLKTLLRHHALSAVKNMTYWSSSPLKIKTSTCLTWEYMVALLRDADPTVQTEMLGILRNVACNEAVDIELVMRGIGEARLLMLIEDALYNTRHDMLLHALYLVVNIATGTDAHHNALMNRQGIIRAIYTHLSHPAAEIRVAAVWAIVNLTHRNESSHRRHNDRLRALGVEQKLKEMRDDPSIDVRERVRDALESNFDTSEMPGGMIID